MVSYNIQEATGVIAAIVKENGTAVIKDPSDVAITYVNGGVVTKFVFLESATSYGLDASKQINKKDIVGTQNKKITEGSTEDSFKYDALAIDPAALGDATNIITSGTCHGLNAATANQFLINTLGLRKLLHSTNTVTIRLFIGCTLDANNDADITTAKEIVDLERVHISSNNLSAAGGGDVTVSCQFDAETISYPAAYNTAPN